VALVGRDCPSCWCGAESLVVLVGRVGLSICAYCLRVLLGVCRGCLESRRVRLIRASRLALLVPGNHLDLGSCLARLVVSLV